MNLWVVIAVMVPVLAILFFGSNPLREHQQRSKELTSKYGQDELSWKTNMQIEKSQQGSFAGFGGTGGESPLKAPSENEMLSSIKASNDPKAAATPFGVNQGEVQNPNGMAVNPSGTGFEIYQEPTTTANPQRNIFERGKDPLRTRASNYYPPVVKSMREMTLEMEAAAAGPKVELTGKEARLRSGQPIIFDGAYIYTTDASGRRRSMPDGRYVLQDGSSITVSGGVRALVQE